MNNLSEKFIDRVIDYVIAEDFCKTALYDYIEFTSTNIDELRNIVNNNDIVEFHFESDGILFIVKKTQEEQEECKKSFDNFREKQWNLLLQLYEKSYLHEKIIKQKLLQRQEFVLLASLTRRSYAQFRNFKKK